MAYSRIMSLVCWRKTSELGLRPGLASLSLPDMGKSPCSVWICFAYSHINSTFFFFSLLVCVYESALKGKEYSLYAGMYDVLTFLYCPHLLPSFFPESVVSIQPCADRFSDHHQLGCRGASQMRLFCSDRGSLCIV